MKRFFCPFCKKVKRVRKYPALTRFSREVPPKNPVDRIGACDRHFKDSDKIPYGKLISAKELTSKFARGAR